MTPQRIQRKRTKGWKMPPNTVCVTRPGKWGNPFTKIAVINWYLGDYMDDRHAIWREEAVALFKAWMLGFMDKEWIRISPEEFRVPVSPPVGLDELRGKNLACWCPLDQPCHADVLLELANPPIRSTGE